MDSGQMEVHALWSEFLQRSQTSPRAQGLQLFAKLVQKSPVEDRAGVAVLVASLLDPLEWPPEWEQHRPGLVEALKSLSSVISPGPDSLTVLLGLKPGEAVMSYWVGGFMFSTASQLLSIPCRRDELHPVARLCCTGLGLIIQTYRREFAKAGESSLSGSILEARMRFAAAFDRYAQAARALNAAAGEVLFVGLDEWLEMPET
jgi:hypothetical protein